MITKIIFFPQLLVVGCIFLPNQIHAQDQKSFVPIRELSATVNNSVPLNKIPLLVATLYYGLHPYINDKVASLLPYAEKRMPYTTALNSGNIATLGLDMVAKTALRKKIEPHVANLEVVKDATTYVAQQIVGCAMYEAVFCLLAYKGLSKNDSYLIYKLITDNSTIANFSLSILWTTTLGLVSIPIKDGVDKLFKSFEEHAPIQGKKHKKYAFNLLDIS